MKHMTWKKATSLFLSFIMILALVPMASAVSPSDFTDFPKGWSNEAVTAAVENGLLNGRSADKIEPQGKLTRAEMATIINRAFGATIEADVSAFTDLEPNAWYYHEIAKAVNMETFQGNGDNTMRPDDSITREEVFAVIARALVLESKDFSSLTRFQDAEAVSNWAKPYASILVAKGYVNGDDLGNLNPRSDITREEFAQIMHNIIKTYYVTSGKYDTVGIDSALIRTSGVTLKNVTIEGDLILGDGVGVGDVTLENVTIKGRLLARGGEGKVRLINTTVGESVVVKDVNGVVNFQNFRTENPFKNLIEITKATFLGTMGGSYTGGDTTYTVTFYDGVVEEESKVIGTSQVKENTKMTQSEIDAVLDGFTPYSYDGYKDGAYVHKIYPELWYIAKDGTWKIFDTTVPVNADMNVYYAFKNLALFFNLKLSGLEMSKTVQFSVPYQTDTRLMDSVKDALTLGRNQLKLALNTDDVYMDAIAKGATKFGDIIDANGNIKYLIVDAALSDIIKTGEVDGEIKEYIKKLIVENSDDAKIDSVFEHAIGSDVVNNILGGTSYDHALIKAHINSLSEGERIQLAEDLHTALSQKTFYQEFINAYASDHADFHVTPESIDLIMAVATAVNEYTYEELEDRINKTFGGIIKLLGKNAAKDFLRDAQDRYYAGALEVWNQLHASSAYDTYYPAYLTFKLDPIEHLFRPLYSKGRNALLNKLEANSVYRYNENGYLKQFMAELETDTLIADLLYPVAQTEENIGYALWPSTGSESGFLHYYDYMLEKLILFDKAMLWYKDNLSSAEMKELKNKIFEDLATFANKANELLDAYEADGSLPMGMNIDDLKKFGAFNKIFNKVEGKLTQAIDRYKGTSFYGKVWDANSIKTDIPYTEEAVDVLLGLDDPTFNLDSLMNKDNIFDKLGFTDYTYSEDQAMGTVTIQAIQRILKGSTVKARRYYQ